MNTQNKRLRSKQLKKKSNPGGILIKSCCLGFIFLIFIIGGGGLLIYNTYNNAIYSPNPGKSDTATIQIQDGDTLDAVASSLQNDGVIQNALALRLYIKLNKVTANIKPGTYQIPKNLTIDQVIKDLEKGTLKAALPFTIKDSVKYEDIATALDTAFNTVSDGRKFDKKLFLSIAQNPDNYTFKPSVQTFLTTFKPKGKTLIGFIFPDTYQFYTDATSQDVIEVILSNFSQKLADNNVTPSTVKSHQKVLNSFYEVLSLASIVQKESGKPADSANIASVFYNRLSDNYPLESDVTINFALNNSNPVISIPDTLVDSPYNTYTHSGVTPTPICSVSLNTLLATLNPTDTSYYFFIYDKNGNIFLSKTYTQHQNNVYKHL